MTRRGVVLFAVVGLIWGLPYLLVKVAVDELAPTQVMFWRCVVGALVLLPVAAASGQLSSLRPHWRAVIVFATVEMTLPWTLLARAEEQLPSSLAALLVATVPVVAIVIGVVTRDADPLRRSGLLGVALGLVGVGCVVGFDLEGADLGAVAMMLAVAVCYAVGPWLLHRRLPAAPPIGVVSVSMVVAAATLAPYTLTRLPARAPSSDAVLAVVALGVVCSAVAFVTFSALIREIGPVRSTLVTYVNPAVALVLGVVFLDESFGLATAAGFVLIIAGSWLATRRQVVSASST